MRVDASIGVPAQLSPSPTDRRTCEGTLGRGTGFDVPASRSCVNTPAEHCEGWQQMSHTLRANCYPSVRHLPPILPAPRQSRRAADSAAELVTHLRTISSQSVRHLDFPKRICRGLYRNPIRMGAFSSNKWRHGRNDVVRLISAPQVFNLLLFSQESRPGNRNSMGGVVLVEGLGEEQLTFEGLAKAF